jgi:acyl-CoA reductase-like NAD-dependent aldehyde dehydrogenase
MDNLQIVYKQSGVGREYGDYGFEEFLEIKSMQL